MSLIMFSDSKKNSSSVGLSNFDLYVKLRRENFTGSGFLVKTRFSAEDTIRLVII